MHTILFVELLGGIGDVVMALPAIHALKRSHPSAHLTVLTVAPGSELLQFDPWIDAVSVARAGEARQALDQLLTTHSFDLIVSDTNYDGIAAAIDHSGAPYRVTNLWRSPPIDEWVSDRFLNLLFRDGWITAEAVKQKDSQIYLTDAERAIARQNLATLPRPLIVLCPEAGMPIKQWSIDHFATLGRDLQRLYGATIVVPEGADRDRAAQLVGAIGGSAHCWQRASLRSVAAVLAVADLAIAADTGLARIAAALDAPTITLFGPSWAGRYGQPAPHINLQGCPDCPERVIANFTQQSCWYSGICPFAWNTCLDDISPQTVLNAAATVLHSCHRQFNQPQSLRWECAASPEIRVDPAHSAQDWHSIQNLLVMRLDNIGDVMMISPALRALRQNLPDAGMTLMTSPGGAQTVPLLPWVDAVLPAKVLWQDLGRLEFDPDREWQLIETLRQGAFDAAIIFTSFSQSPHPPALLCALAGIPLRLGESLETDLHTLTHWVPFAPIETHQVERNLRLIESVGFHVSDRRLALPIPDDAQHQVQQRLIHHHGTLRPYILLNPWTSCQSRNYEPDRFVTATRRLQTITGWTVVVTGVKKDRDRSRPLLQALGNGAIDLIGETTLPELVALVAGARLVLTNNTSTMHIADATQTPSVILFAGTELESQWRPRHSPSQLLRRPTACSPCYTFTCPYHLECLDIDPEAIVQASLSLLDIPLPSPLA